MPIPSTSNQVINFARAHSPALATPGQIVKNIQKLALPAIILAGIATLDAISADNQRCIECMNSCDRIEHELFKLACYTFCVFGSACRH
ncbi:MAG: hypothetical protein ACRDAI_00155 [Candidatus Rhabdochlamydia sp.]